MVGSNFSESRFSSFYTNFGASSETRCSIYCRLFFSRRDEPNLVALGHVKMISRTRTPQNDSVFSRPWHPSASHLYKTNFLSTKWSDLSNFWLNFTTGAQSIISRIFRHKVSRRVISKTFLNFLIFSGSKSLFFSVLSSQWNANVFALVYGGPFGRLACCDIFSFFWSVYDRLKSEKLRIFRNSLP